MKSSKKTLLLMTLISIPAMLLLYYVAEWTIWQIAIIFAVQTIYYNFVLKKQEKRSKEEWDEKWGKGQKK